MSDIETPTFVSDRSVHRLFLFPNDLDLKAVKKIQGLEIRLGTAKAGAQSVLPPSRHHSGKTYTWTTSLDDVPIAEFPECLRKLIETDQQNKNRSAKEGNGREHGLTFTMQSQADAVARAKAYVDQMPHAIEGEGGDKMTYRVACVAAIDFGLSKPETMEVLNRYNQRCEPPWELNELEHKAEMACEEAIKRPSKIGNLRDKDCSSMPASTCKNKTPPVRLPNTVQSFEPFPTDVLPGVLADLVKEGATSIGCDPSFIALPVLAVVASAIGNTHRLVAKQDWRVPPILWTAIIGDSGALKSPGVRLAVMPLREIQREKFANHAIEMAQFKLELSVFKKAMAIWTKEKGSKAMPVKPESPVIQRLLVSDITIEALAPILHSNPRGLLVEVDELASWLGSFDKYSKGSGDSAKYLSMYNADSLIVDRKTGEPKTIYVPSAAVSITGGIQPGILARLATREHFESGLVARFLLACPPRRIAKWNDKVIPQNVVDNYVSLLTHLYHLGDPEKITYVGMSGPAKQLYTSFFNAHAEEQIEVGGDLAAAYSKLQEHPLRIALVLHCCQRRTGAVQTDTMESAIVLAEWFKRETIRVYQRLSEDSAEQWRRELVEWIQNKHSGIVTARQVQQGRWRIKTSDDANAFLQELVDTGYGKWIPTEAGNRGQPTRRFQLNDVYIYGNVSEPGENTNTVDVDDGEQKNDDPGIERI